MVKLFVGDIVSGCGAGEMEAVMYIMFQKWMDFDAGWKRQAGNDENPPGCRSLFILFMPGASIAFSPFDGLTGTCGPSYGRSSAFKDSMDSGFHDSELLRRRD